MSRLKKGSQVRRLSAALAAGLAIVVGASAARADDHLLNVELTGGAGVSAYNSGSDSVLAPPFVQLHAAYLLLETGPVAMGPALGVPLGFYQSEDEADEGSWVPQVAVRPGWAVYGRPSVDYAWSVVAGPSFVVTPPFVWGLEVGGSFTYFLTAGFGLVVGVDYGFFYGVDPAHIFSAKLGLMISW
jgi:hypothetical protein